MSFPTLWAQIRNFANVGETKIRKSKQQKLLGILIDRDLKFDEYILSQCKKAGKGSLHSLG